MNKTIAYVTLIAFATLICVLSAVSPSALGDKNKFLMEFVNHELINVLGIIVAITISSAANLHLVFNQIEERFKRRGLTKARAGVRQAAHGLIILFLIGIFLVVVKPILVGPEWAASLLNGTALLIVLWNILVLISLTQAVFAVEPIIPDEDEKNRC